MAFGPTPLRKYANTDSRPALWRKKVITTTRFRRRRHADARVRHRGQRGDFQCGQRRAVALAAIQRSERLMLLWEANGRVRNNHISHQNFADWRAQQHSFEAISAYSGRWGGPETITGGSEPERAYVVRVYRDFFNTLGVAPSAGRVFLPE